MKIFSSRLFQFLAVLIAVGLPGILFGSVRQAPALNVTVDIEHFYPVAGSSANQSGTVGNFGTFHWVGQKSSNQAGTVESTSVAPSILFSSMNAIGISLSASSVSESAPVGQGVGIISSFNLSNPVYTLLNNAGGKFSLLGNQIRIAQSLDFETQSSHIIRIRATGTEGQVERDFPITVLDVTDEDDDGDGLSQAREYQLGTNPRLADTDGDGYSDGVEVNAGSNPLDAQSFPAWTASLFNLNARQVEENLPAGSPVGQFLYGDVPLSTGVNVTILSGDGSDAFSVDQNGTLLTKAPLDFEKKPSYNVSVRASHSSGAVFEKTFIVYVVDSFIPIVYTERIVQSSGTSATLEGQVIDEGGTTGVSERGIIIALFPNPLLGETGVQKLPSGNGPGKFLATVDGLEKGRKYFIRAYARNNEGIAYGSELTLKTPATTQSPAWAKAEPAASANWWTSPWFGSFYMNDGNAWVMHSELGWLYPMAPNRGGIWLWKENMGWLWTDQQYFPFLYQNTSAGWLYFYGASQDRLLFYHYRDERWIQQTKQSPGTQN